MKRLFVLLLIAVSAGVTTGCAGMPKSWTSAMPWAEKPSQIIESSYQSPVKMVAIWSPAMYNAPGKTPTRGFGGRLYFYNAKNETIPVQGQLVVYCFDDTNKSNDHKQADRRVAFTPEQFSGHFSPTELGASYSVWVPWDAVGSPQAEISLVPIFTAAAGKVVVGQQSLALLPGPETPIQEKRVDVQVLTAKTTQDGDVTHVGYTSADSAMPFGPSGIKSMSITLPQSLAERVAASRNQELREITQGETNAGSGQPQLLPADLMPVGKIENAPAELNPSENSKVNSALPNQTRKIGPLTHSERSQPRAPTMQPPRPIAGPAPMQPPLGERPLSRP